MINLSRSTRNLDQYKYKYFVDAAIDGKTLIFEIFEDKKIILQKRIPVRNMEQIFDFCDCVSDCLESIRSKAFDNSLDVMAELTSEKTRRIEDFSISPAKELHQEIDAKIEEVIFHHE